ncbi:MAG TPA: alpha/beta hydrolase [Caulobacter sp.]|nr:alpha/beta hydrolase [Caulobacter sp.]
MALDPVLQQLLALIPEMTSGPVDYPALRATASSFNAMLVGPNGLAEVGGVAEAHCSGPAGNVPMRIYRPPGTAQGVLHYIHGGGWSIGDLDTVDHTARYLCRALSMVVVTSTYRLAPEHPFPAAFDDSLAAARWVLRNQADLAGPNAPRVVSGDSAGGNLAAAICLALRDNGEPTFDLQLLLYPALDLREGDDRYASRRADADPSLRKINLQHALEAYGGRAHALNPLMSPLLAADLSRLPAALVVVLSVDPLRDEAMLYAERLRDAGVRVELMEFENLTHGFVHLGGLVPAAAQATDEVVKQLRAMLAAG